MLHKLARRHPRLELGALEKEVVLAVRFAAHVDAVRGALGNGKEAVGKQLGFLLQELGRETNTIGSKANNAVIAEAVIAMKGELERMREQIENLE